MEIVENTFLFPNWNILAVAGFIKSLGRVHVS